MKSSFFALFFSLALATQAQATWLFEPAVGYQVGTLANADVSTPSLVTTWAETGTMASLKAGYIFSNRVSLAAEYSMISAGKLTNTLVTSAFVDFTRADTFINLGYEGGRSRFFVGYGVGNSMTFISSNPNQKYSGSSMKIGLGYLISSNFSLNLEYLVPRYTTIEANGTSAAVSEASSKFDTASYNLNLSFPFAF